MKKLCITLLLSFLVVSCSNNSINLKNQTAMDVRVYYIHDPSDDDFLESLFDIFFSDEESEDEDYETNSDEEEDVEDEYHAITLSPNEKLEISAAKDTDLQAVFCGITKLYSIDSDIDFKEDEFLELARKKFEDLKEDEGTD